MSYCPSGDNPAAGPFHLLYFEKSERINMGRWSPMNLYSFTRSSILFEVPWLQIVTALDQFMNTQSVMP